MAREGMDTHSVCPACQAEGLQGPAGRVGLACGSRRMGPRVASDGPAGRVGWACGSCRMGPRVASRRMHPAGPARVASDGPAGRIEWARGPGRMIQQVASDRPAGRV